LHYRPSRDGKVKHPAEAFSKAANSVLATSGCGRHAAAFVRTTPAGGRTFLAVAHLVPGAFISAGLADVSAYLADSLGELAAPRHVCGGEAADLRAVHIQGYAARHHLDVLFLQARCRAMVAGDGAGVTGFDAGCVLLVRHDGLQSISLRKVKLPAWRAEGMAFLPIYAYTASGAFYVLTMRVGPRCLVHEAQEETAGFFPRSNAWAKLPRKPPKLLQLPCIGAIASRGALRKRILTETRVSMTTQNS
jgi:hypothetical protein